MCGICGVWGLSEGIVTVRHMCHAMIHRGPDSDGYYENGQVALGMRRLRIIDLVTGEQPIFNEDRTIAIVFNGEIYNYRELMSELEEGGHHFATSSDTEAIVHAYEEWGDDCPNHLRGMFAFAIHDRRPNALNRGGPNGRLFLARDRLGIKPLYYAQIEEAITFASEVKALLASRFVARKLDRLSIARYLQWGSVPGPETIIEGVRLLRPGHSLAIDSKGTRESPYWGQTVSPTPVHSLAEAFEGVRERLADAVRAEMVADVPVGAFLSGGLDSTAVVALMAPHASGRLRTFSISFDENSYNETRYMELVANRFGTDHHDCRVTGQDVERELDHFIASLDQPSIDGLNTYFVSKFTRESGVTVALSGLGGDELFGGYPSFRLLPWWALAMRIRGALPGSLSLGKIVTRTSQLGGIRRKFYEVLGTDGSIPALYAVYRGLFMGESIAYLLAPGFTDGLILPEAAKEVRMRAGLPNGLRGVYATTSWLEMSLYMGNQLLRDTDSMSMAHSLEVRVPLLDYRLVEYMLGLPEELKRNSRVPKLLLAQAMAPFLPTEITQRKKMTFTFPMTEWMRGRLRSVVQDTLCSPSVTMCTILDATAMRHIWEEFMAGRVGWTRLWALAVLVMWIQNHLRD